MWINRKIVFYIYNVHIDILEDFVMQNGPIVVLAVKSCF